MPTRECFNVGEDGKVQPGVTVLRDPQTGQLYDVEIVMSGRMPMPESSARNQASAERCALNGGARVHSERGRS